MFMISDDLTGFTDAVRAGDAAQLKLDEDGLEL